MTATLRMALLAGLLWPIAAMAQTPAPVPGSAPACDVPAYLTATDITLGKVEAAIKTKGALAVLVVGSRSSTLAQPEAAYPGRLQQFLTDKLPGIAVNVTVDLQSKRTAEEVVAGLAKSVDAGKPDLVIWQTGTVDAMRGIDPDDFRGALEDGVTALKKAGTDVILMNLQYSPRTETMVSPAPYVDNMRVVAQQDNVALFDRFAIMRQWNDNGDFDLFDPSPSAELAKRVHECLARALATFVIDAAHVNATELKVQR